MGCCIPESILLIPFMHTTSERMQEQLGLSGEKISWEDAFVFDKIDGEKVTKGDPLFPRLDIEKELKELNEIQQKQMAAAKKKADKEAADVKLKPEIEFEDFDKIDLRVGTIMKAEKVQNADKLLKFRVRIGNEERQILSGVAEYFRPEDMVGKKVIVAANLKPKKIRGEESLGMIIFADTGKKLELVTSTADDGSKVR
jgi:methionyl-tRNA synthetase